MTSWLPVPLAERVFSVMRPQANRLSASLRLGISACTSSFLAMTPRPCPVTSRSHRKTTCATRLPRTCLESAPLTMRHRTRPTTVLLLKEPRHLARFGRAASQIARFSSRYWTVYVDCESAR